MSNIITMFQEKNIIAGSFPVVVDSLEIKTNVLAGDIIGVSATKTFGKLDDATYTEVFGIAYDDTLATTPCTVILTGEIAGTFVNIPESKELEIKNSLRKISLFIK